MNWLHLVCGLAGFSLGLIVMYKLMGEQISITVRKVKNKRTSGSNSVTIPIEVDKNRSKLGRKERRLKRKQ